MEVIKIRGFLCIGNKNLEEEIEDLDVDILDKEHDLETLYDLLDYIEVDFIIINRLLDDDEGAHIKKIAQRAKKKNIKIIVISDDFNNYNERKLITTLINFDVNVFLRFSEIYKIEEYIKEYPIEFDFRILSKDLEEKNTLREKIEKSDYINQITKGFKRIIAVASFAPTGKSYVASNLAYILSKQGIKTALVDADFKNRAISYYYYIHDEEKKNAYRNILQDLSESTLNNINDYCFNDFDGNLNVLTNIKYDEFSETVDFKVDIETFFTIIDNLRVENEIVIIDMSRGLNEYSKRILNLVDTILFVQNLDYRMMDLNKAKLNSLDKSILKKMVLVVNNYIENKDLKKDIIKDFFEIDFAGIGVIPQDSLGAIKNIRYGKSFIDEDEEVTEAFKDLSQFCYKIKTEKVKEKKGIWSFMRR